MPGALWLFPAAVLNPNSDPQAFAPADASGELLPFHDNDDNQALLAFAGVQDSANVEFSHPASSFSLVCRHTLNDQEDHRIQKI